jgi:tellurite methyltransferase
VGRIIDRDWEAFYAYQQTRTEVRPLLLKAIAYADPTGGRAAVDLGCGQGFETIALLDAGWTVTAVDSSAAGLALVREGAGDRPGLSLVGGSMADVPIPPADLVHASFALPFCPPEHFAVMWEHIRAALRPGGLLAVNFFGPHDTWAGEEGMSFHSETEVREMLDGLEVLELTERDEDGMSGAGPKHWHVFDVLARRPERAPDR